MKKQILAFSLFLLSSLGLVSQTNATDFTANDCDGVTHNLFSELNNEQVVVIAWVMPCATCIQDPLNAYVAVESYALSHPGRVKFYLVDDYADTPCQSLETWANNYGMGSCTMFSDAAVDMGDYGQPGMPKIVVLGSSDHKIYFNQNSSSQGIDLAIDLALSESSTSIKSNLNFTISTFPNPATNSLNINYNLVQKSKLTFEIFNLLGANVITHKNDFNQLSGAYKLNVSNLKNGTYLLKVSTENGQRVIKFSVSN
ncbi:MAG: T9SS type A sorting domain-containing protein [Flavobacteriales bacterium]|jgi:hypothetical protein|nr:T9SS type A sorting domain-containing protein [Flavobacteriales bacterium]